MKRHSLDFLNDILEYASQGLNFIVGMSFEDFYSDTKTKYAVFRALEVIGEASKHIPSAIKKKYPNIDWKRISGMRDKLIHEYTGIDYQIVWETINDNIPIVIQDIKIVINDYKKENPDLFNI